LRPKQSAQKLNRVINAWQTLAPDKSFGGMTLPRFKAVAQGAQDAVASLHEIEDRRTQAINQRDDAFVAFFRKVELVVNGVCADPTEGPDSALYEAMGHTRKSERKTGRTRKRPPTPNP